ncbi:MAG: hypothetical protein A2787_04970 [Omnitrophica WOR_2 bacterium RIFCSPHIGHO2_01_FULL_48_9]|nr:MAG: hypothetical protein A2787_04970 [Omnitrophica WOR_2 bacterium RIFCSPHIGHO2_01_FULL_48_9]
MPNQQEKSRGELFTFSSALLWAFFPVVTVLTYAVLPSLVSLAWSTLLAALFFALLITYRGKWKELNNLLLWKYGFYIALFTGILYYSLYFIGLETTTPGNSALIAQFEVFTSFLFFRLFRGERMSKEYIIGSVLTVLGAAIVLGKDFSGINIGDLFVLGATIGAPIGNFFQQKAREIASSEVIMFLRSAISAPAIFFLVYLFQAQASAENLRDSLLFLVLNGILLFGLSKILWIEGIHRISVTKATALSSVTPLLTLLFAWIILQQVPTVWQITSLVPLITGVLLLTDHIKLNRKY